MKITDEQTQAGYEIATAVYDGAMSAKAGVQRLHTEHGVNAASAQDFITIFKSMMEGKAYHRTLSIPATRYFFGRIAAERGSVALANAIEATRQHLDYYERLENGGTQPTKRAILREYVAHPPQLQDLGVITEEFARKVDTSAADTPDARLARLRAAVSRPAKVRVTTEIYVRNPDVVAEALYRAQGRCGRCGEPAPFHRSRDGTPYLEVHHKKQLKDGGDDTVENAIALCPNCHRHQHYGLPDR